MGNKVTVAKPKTTNYSVSGKTLKEVWASIQKKGPNDPNDNKKVAALTETTIIVADKWDPETRGGSCLDNGKIETWVGAKNMSMKIEGSIQMPKLGSNKLSKTAKKEWDRFIGKLDKHEREHLAVTAKVAKTMGDEIMKIEGVGLGDDEKKSFEAGKADFLKRYVTSYTGKKLSARITEASKKFDKSSKHGAKHGAVLDLDIS
jgi:predicted secreted Zn-dependent protease